MRQYSDYERHSCSMWQGGMNRPSVILFWEHYVKENSKYFQNAAETFGNETYMHLTTFFDVDEGLIETSK